MSKIFTEAQQCNLAEYARTMFFRELAAAHRVDLDVSLPAEPYDRMDIWSGQDIFELRCSDKKCDLVRLDISPLRRSGSLPPFGCVWGNDPGSETTEETIGTFDVLDVMTTSEDLSTDQYRIGNDLQSVSDVGADIPASIDAEQDVITDPCYPPDGVLDGVISDPNLLKRLKKLSGKSESENLTVDDAQKLQMFVIPHSDIVVESDPPSPYGTYVEIGTLDGMECFPNIQAIGLPDQGLIDVTPLCMSSGTAVYLELSNMPNMSDFEQLACFGNAQVLNLTDNSPHNIEFTRGMSQLNMIGLINNGLQDVTPLIDNPNFAAGATAYLAGNPLIPTEQIEALIAKGVTVVLE